MPPRKNKAVRVNTAVKAAAVGGENGHLAGFSAASNPSTFQTLPQELLLAIVHQLDLTERTLLSRRRHTFSWLCRATRQVSLPINWRSFDIFPTKLDPGRTQDASIAGAENLERLSLFVIECEHVQSLVRHVRIFLTRRRTSDVLPLFARALQLLPNAETLDIPHVHTAMTTHIKDGFRGCTFASIRHVLLQSWAHNIVRLCPNASSITIRAGQKDTSKVVSAIAEACPNVSEIKDFRLSDDNTLKRLVKAVPNLKVYTDSIGDMNIFKYLQKFKGIDCIKRTVSAAGRGDENISKDIILAEPVLAAYIQEAWRFLRAQPNHVQGNSRVVILYQRSVVGYWLRGEEVIWSHTIKV
ncbi:hypothetical protein BKA62DRAFT_660764 [Auriculariales sp. MPI-PUGE-AT-0066]|nr:hypothetical protein BKA62DRAFT_660764 [Auriculariales sp. MPI-PUGE-AT-0066]